MSKNEQTFDIEAGGKEFKFTVNRDSYNKYVNGINQKDKVAPSHNFLMMTVDDKQRATLKEVLANNPGAEVEIAGGLYEAYTPDIGLVVKKSSSAQSE